MAVPDEKGTGKQNKQQRPNAQDGGTGLLIPGPHPWPSSRGSWPPEERHKTSQGSRAPKTEDANPTEETQLLPGAGPLQPSRSQGHRVTFGAEFLTQHSSIPGSACLGHTPTLREVTGGDTALKHPGIYRKTNSAWLNCLVGTRDCFFV